MAKTVRSVLAAWIVGAVLIDVYLFITDVLILHVAGAMSLFQWDGSNVLGDGAYQEGWRSVLIGCALHASVSLVWAILYVSVATITPVFTKRPVLVGAIFGVFVMSVMRFLVLPLGHAQQPGWNWVGTLNTVIAHVLFFGIPVALAVRRTLGLVR